MNEKYKAELVAWALRTALVIALAVAASLIQRWLGVTVEAPPPPPVTVIVEPAPGSVEPPKVTVFNPINK